MRSLILDYDILHFKNDPNPQGSFKRQYANKRDEDIADQQQSKQSSVY